MNEAPRSSRIEGQEGALLSFRLPSQLKKDFVSYLRKQDSSFSLEDFLQRPEVVAADREYDAECKKRGIATTSRPPSEVVDAFSQMFMQISDPDGSGKVPGVLVRWLKADNELHLRKIVDGLNQNGGKIGDLKGVCMSAPGSKADDTILMQMASQEGLGVLLMYDPEKLEELDQEERRSDPSFYAGYGYKPKKGETFRTALLGTIVL